ncbi:cwf18 pre-mRNA splicing factor-domain-containing protein [Mrakia frigida]|uniref:CCDC12/cwf18 family protein n=1 Tax=Mrakia frigida TaxID=29902 RepID=UPI003FCBEF49
MSLADAAAARKDRLEALRKRKAGDVSVEGSVPVLKQRNFDSDTRTAKKFSRSDLNGETIESQVEGLAERITAEDEARRTEELNLLNIAPKRPNWDLKRDLDRITQKLKPQTDEAIKSIIRKRLVEQKGTAGGMDLVGALDALNDVEDDEVAGERSDDE